MFLNTTRSELFRRQLLAAEILAPPAFGCTLFDLAPGRGLLIGLALAQLQQEARILDLFLELAQGSFYVAVLHQYRSTV